MEDAPRFSVAERWVESRAWRAESCAGGDGAEPGPATGGRNSRLVELHNDVAQALVEERAIPPRAPRW